MTLQIDMYSPHSAIVEQGLGYSCTFTEVPYLHSRGPQLRGGGASLDGELVQPPTVAFTTRSFDPKNNTL